MKKATTTLFFLAGGLDGSLAYQNDHSAVAPTLSVWPQPSQMAPAQSVPSWEIDQLALDYSGTSALVTDAFSRFEKAVGAPKKVLGKNKMHVVVTVAEEGVTSLGLHTDESYTLEVAQPNATITAPTAFGAMHALQTLSQIVDPGHGGLAAKPATLQWEVTINDAPRFAHRGIMLDTSRNFMELSALRRTLDAMAMNKLNVLHWHVSDAQSFPFESQAYPELSLHGAYDKGRVYDAAAVKALLAYARARGVRVIPEFDMPGHAWKGFAGWAQEHNEREITVCGGHEPWGEMCAEPPCGQLDPTNNFTYTVVEALWKDVADAFGDEQFVHVGGDEVNAACWNSSASIRAWMTSNGLPPADRDSFTSLWGIFQDRLDAIITAPAGKTGGGLGKTMIKWDDSFLAGQAGSKDTVIQVRHRLDTRLLLAFSFFCLLSTHSLTLTRFHSPCFSTCYLSSGVARDGHADEGGAGGPPRGAVELRQALPRLRHGQLDHGWRLVVRAVQELAGRVGQRAARGRNADEGRAGAGAGRRGGAVGRVHRRHEH